MSVKKVVITLSKIVDVDYLEGVLYSFNSLVVGNICIKCRYVHGLEDGNRQIWIYWLCDSLWS